MSITDEAWGKLKSTKPQQPSLSLFLDKTNVGRNKSLGLKCEKISSHHFTILTKKVNDTRITTIIDNSRNGTWLNGIQLEKGVETVINMFDEISVLNPELKESAQYLYFEMGVINQLSEYSNNFFKRYVIQELIGRGSFGQVRKAFDMTSKEIRAIKIMKNKPNKKYKENEIVQSLHHQNIVTTYESYQIGEYIIIVMEYLPGGSLQSILKRCGKIDIQVLKKISLQLLNALQYLHSNKIVHRDVKPENVLFSGTKSEIKITDFGTARIVGEGEMAKTLCGTPTYFSPELFKGWNEYKKLSINNELPKEKKNFLSKELQYDAFKVDVWSCGVLMYTLAVGRNPFEFNGHFEQKKLFNGSFNTDELFSCLPDELKDLIEHMIVIDPLKRYSVKECLSHEFFTRKSKTTQFELPKKKKEITKDILKYF
ncbi:protein kinase domain containing protein [Entamoeba histolytica HM-1:IMSS-B]|uniref:Protein kinase, putative n=6 Tax=Entamoeba histolytica TaxID=5759 RepID=C4LYQ8_ENTH1|nr:protein kinase, putative [Entamoeba histolytica HM-1:IMSS]EMD45809.1 meiosis specific serine/threonine protein kinase MEK1, putative [Entamoeba histolytica KU27]EMH76707.1 protein kinase domain containing protein [Entamoeba histolytica HM-1:IMSS-B]EMS13716.1 meiosis-specific serine/threonine protein kinase MEK1, putative [Entamoeba histolytica HM-3:IMSS]ENY62992.1 meiosis-specific serine/threonine protein kinase MEK1, putative [Entamoeba histolytica HM-1:IMSS-A]GAT93968.1 protein kinase dom|eukprot:XP_656728.1 protein kinase, putative [Entamoeba histolytica HM-1:IMSS]